MKQIEDLKQRQENLELLHSPAGNEIYTPLSLVKEILDKLPIYVWSNPNYKWLNPACKNGVWLSEIIIRLFNGLVNWEQDEEKRYNHIIDNIVYGYAYSRVGLPVTRKTIYGNKNIDGNVQLVEFWREETNMKFDVIVGNPPYQAPQSTQNPGGSSITLWDKFIKKSFNLLNENGYLCFVNPSKWRNINNNLWKLMSTKQIHYLEIHGHSDGMKIFGAQTRYDWYVLQNCKIYKDTIIKDQCGEKSKINLTNISFIPNYDIDKIYSLFAKDNEEKVEILYDRSLYGTDYAVRNGYLSEQKTNKNKYPCVYAIDVSNKIKEWWANRDDLGHFGIPKVVISSGHHHPNRIMVDKTGKYALTQFAYAIIDKKEKLDLIAKALKTEKFKNVAMAISTRAKELDRSILTMFRKDFWKEFI